MSKPRFIIVSFFLSLVTVSLFPSRNVSKWLPFLERPEEYVTKKRSYFYPALFITTASTAFRCQGGNSGIPELWGGYDLKDVIAGLKATCGEEYNPFSNEIGYTDWDEKELNAKDSIIMHTNYSKYRELKRKLVKQKRIKI